MAHKMSKKRIHFNYKQSTRSLYENGDMLLHNMTVGEYLPTVADLMASPLAKYITLAANNCGYDGTMEELIINYVHPLFLKSKPAANLEDNQNWREATTGVFADNYWK